MLRHKVVSVFLVLLVTVLCPAACGLRAFAAADHTPATDCCGHRLPAPDRPSGPELPTNQSPDACFCSTQGVTINKTDACHLTVFLFLFTNDVHEDFSLNTSSTFGIPQAACFRPPDQQRILPLLI